MGKQIKEFLGAIFTVAGVTFLGFSAIHNLNKRLDAEADLEWCELSNDMKSEVIKIQRKEIDRLREENKQLKNSEE